MITFEQLCIIETSGSKYSTFAIHEVFKQYFTEAEIKAVAHVTDAGYGFHRVWYPKESYINTMTCLQTLTQKLSEALENEDYVLLKQIKERIQYVKGQSHSS